MKHKHAELIKAWADGADIEGFWSGNWQECKNPTWWEENEYRIKPERKQIQYNDPTDDVDNILDCFDFEKVKKVMDYLNWEWAGCDGVPEIYELRKRARELLRIVVVGVQKKESEGQYFTATGGFYAQANVYPNDPKIYLRLSFNLTDWDNLE